MICFLLLVLVHCCLAAKPVGTREGSVNPNPQKQAESPMSLVTPECMGVVGNYKGCRECYPCDSEFIINYMKTHKNGDIDRISVTNRSCISIEACCVQPPAKTHYADRSAQEPCGIVNPQGSPRALRTQVLQVLPGEYPWRAWVFEDGQLICGATLVSRTYRIMVTSATCIVNAPAKHLRVAFSRSPKASEMMTLDKLVHHQFDENKHHNDVAIVIVKPECEYMFPDFASAICLPQTNSFPRDCITISAKDYSINAIIPLKDVCDKDANIKTHESLRCSVLSRSHHIPENGNGLYCFSDQVQSASQYVLFGITLHQQDEFTTIYSNITLSSEWIQSKITEEEQKSLSY